MQNVTPLILSLLAPALTGVLLALAFPSYHLDWLAWIALVPLLLGIREKRPWQAFLVCWLCGVIFFIGITPWWIREFRFVSKLASGLGYLYLGLYVALFGFLLSLIRRSIGLPLIIAAPVWVALEYLRSHLPFLAFPWALLGHTQYLNLPIAQMASFTGAYGVSFLIVMANGAIADIIVHVVSPTAPAPFPQRRGRFAWSPFPEGLFVLVLIAAIWGGGSLALRHDVSARPLSVAVVQGNIPQKIKWDRQYREEIISHYERLTAEAAKSKPRLIVWPEASTPGFVLNDLSLLRRLASMMSGTNAYLLVGSAEYPKFSKPSQKARLSRGNTAMFFSPEGRILGQYLKIRLVPFGEYIPYERIIPWPDFIVQKRKRSFDIAGSEATLFRTDGDTFGTLICWEVLFPEMSRVIVRKGADFIVNITNEAWFRETAFSTQMLSSCVFRAVENRVNLVRCANIGISCFIDPYGRVTGGVSDIFASDTVTRQIRISPPGTFYTRYGDVFAFGCIALSMGLVVWSILGRPRRNQR